MQNGTLVSYYDVHYHMCSFFNRQLLLVVLVIISRTYWTDWLLPQALFTAFLFDIEACGRVVYFTQQQRIVIVNIAIY